MFQSYSLVLLVVEVGRVDVVRLQCRSCYQMHHVDLLEVVEVALCVLEAQGQAERHERASMG